MRLARKNDELRLHLHVIELNIVTVELWPNDYRQLPCIHICIGGSECICHPFLPERLALDEVMQQNYDAILCHVSQNVILLFNNRLFS